MVRSYSQSRRNTIIIALAAAASIAASMAGYYAAEAEKFYHLTNTALTTAVSFEHQADLQERNDEEILIQATIEYQENKTRIDDLLGSQVSQEAKDNMVFDNQSDMFSLTPSTMMFCTLIISTLSKQSMNTLTAQSCQINILGYP